MVASRHVNCGETLKQGIADLVQTIRLGTIEYTRSEMQYRLAVYHMARSVHVERFNADFKYLSLFLCFSLCYVSRFQKY
jgi:hypothetical protein